PGGYACLAGTSMAAPHVSGALALLRSTGLDPEQSIDRLLGTATDLGPTGRDSTYGYGRIDLARAMDRLSATSSGAPDSSTVPSSTTVAGSGAGGATTTTVGTDEVATTISPEVAAPEPQEAAPFSPAPSQPGPTGDVTVPGWLVAIAMAGIATTALGTSAAA